jgi:hypothetical protein
MHLCTLLLVCDTEEEAVSQTETCSAGSIIVGLTKYTFYFTIIETFLHDGTIYVLERKRTHQNSFLSRQEGNTGFMHTV